jgi:hypothetical protein
MHIIFYVLFAEGSPDSHDLAEGHLDFPELRNEDGSYRLIERRPIHVDSGSDGDHESRDTGIQTHFVAAPDRDWHRRRTTTNKVTSSYETPYISINL